MNSEYDQKFEEMKKYIPFLESMIKRLESTGNSSTNPRQAQLDKIRSLRDLLLDKKKRMKMDNLLKCEQVLVNLYAKVEQRETVSADPAFSIDSPTPKEKADLEAVRIKLKSVTMCNEEGPETLPEIARASEIEEKCTPGSKEPALFQRRPNKYSISPTPSVKSNVSPSKHKSGSKRNYTRILLSPETTRRRWSPSKDSQKSLYSRRSPRHSPRRYSPSYHKKDRKKTYRETKDLNITLKVPEKHLSSLNTKDIVSRIINCSDNDVDIKTLRELRSQILGELKQTGSNDDISDLILKSYKQKKSLKKNTDVEEGELSDSESEAIESIYGSLVVVEKDQSTSSHTKNNTGQEQSRKIQICLVINSDKDNSISYENECQNNVPIDDSDFKMYGEKNIIINKIDNEDTIGNKCTMEKEKVESDDKVSFEDTKLKKSVDEKCGKNEVDILNKAKSTDESCVKENNIESSKLETINQTDTVEFRANFYKPMADKTDSGVEFTQDIKKITETEKKDETASITPTLESSDTTSNTETKKSLNDTVEIPLLNEPTVPKKPDKENIVSEIDILQALKNEILSESITIPGSEPITPALHQPKVTKVSSAQEIGPKRKISIEKYKQKSVLPKDEKEDVKKRDIYLSREEGNKKQSLKLTEKECERFKFPVKLSVDGEESSDDISDSIDIDDIYNDLAPKSPDDEEFNELETAPPIIIPVDPIKTTLNASKGDIDMRAFVPMQSPNSLMTSPAILNLISSPNVNMSQESGIIEIQEKSKSKDELPKILDPRFRRENCDQMNRESPNPHKSFSDPSSTGNYLNSHPNMTPSRTANLPSLMSVDTRSFEMTPSHQSYDDSNHKHVYAPMCPIYDARDKEKSMGQDIRTLRDKIDISSDPGRPHRDDYRNNTRQWDEHDLSYITDSDQFNKNPRISRYSIDRRDGNRSEYLNNSSSFLGRADGSGTPSYGYGRDMPRTPIHHFGRSDCPPTPSHSFGRLDCPTTPSHPFGRSECPSTPSHSFGRSECPPTPSHTFGRLECPLTPSHSFGRSEVSMVHNHTYGRSEYSSGPTFSKDPRLNRSSEYESNSNYEDRYYSDRGRNRVSHFSHRRSKHSESRPYYEREHGVSKNDKYDSFHNDRPRYDKGRISRRESSIGCSFLKDDYHNDYSRHYEDGQGLGRENSVGRTSLKGTKSNTFVRTNNVRESFQKSSDKFSVQPDGGRSFTINTSVHTTFQNLIQSDTKTSNDHSFDDRRRRSASVGRSLVREPSLKTSHYFYKPKSNEKDEKKQFDYRRASSVGREVVKSKKERSLTEIKADFRSYWSKNIVECKQSKGTEQVKERKFNYQSPRSTKMCVFNSSQRHDNASKQIYSPRRNIRDPRMRRDQQYDTKFNKNRKDSGDRKNYGIDYSNDNIAKGTILGSGYGVKNYKIPKIKRVEIVEDNDKSVINISDESRKLDAKEKLQVKPIEMDQKDKISPITENDLKSRNVSIETKKENAIYDTSDNNASDKRVTRASTRSAKNEQESSENVTLKSKKYKKLIISDSESDSELINEVTSDKVGDKMSLEPKNTSSPKSFSGASNEVDIKQNVDATEFPVDKVVDDKSVDQDTEVSKLIKDPKEVQSKDSFTSKDSIANCNEALNMSFNMDDLEMFPDTISSDPVIENINALIADLDNDIDTSKIDSKKISIETSSQNAFDSLLNEDKASDLENESNPKVNDSLTGNMMQNNYKPETKLNIDNSDELQKNNAANNEEKNDFNCVSTSNGEENSLSDPDVTTTDEKPTEDVDNKSISEVDNKVNDLCFIPDSTINSVNETTDKCHQGLPDSTHEIQSEIHADTTYTQENIEQMKEVSESSVKVNPDLNSIGNFLSMLQDKSKIKELLSNWDDKTGCEKLKKKLERLSEIVSDDEDTNEILATNEYAKDAHCSNELVDSNIQCHDEVECEFDKNNSKDLETVNPIKKSEESEENNDKNKSVMVVDENNDVYNNENKDSVAYDELVHSNPIINKTFKRGPKKTKLSKKGKRRYTKKNNPTKNKSLLNNNGSIKKPVKNKTSRELRNLQEDIKEMFISGDVLNVPGIRTCRIAKLIDDKQSKEDLVEPVEPVVVLEKFKRNDVLDERKQTKKRNFVKSKSKVNNDIDADEKEVSVTIPKYKPGPKSKTKLQHSQEEFDPYAFETDSVGKSTISKACEDGIVSSSDYETDSIGSSVGSTELLADIKNKKNKRKRLGWQKGVIKSKNRNKKKAMKQKTEYTSLPLSQKTITIPDQHCFTDKNYCFNKDLFTYSCRLCNFSGTEIVHHYKKRHPHCEIPLSRLSPHIAEEAIRQCEEMNFQAISKIPTDKYICRFCFKKFGKKREALEKFFWHVVSMHTGEYKQGCSECVNVNQCPFNLDIPPPPKDIKGQLIGYICGKCNFTQISLENLKTHVIVRHNDEQTEVFTINLAVMTRKKIEALSKQCFSTLMKPKSTESRVLRSSRSTQSYTETSDDRSDITDDLGSDSSSIKRKPDFDSSTENITNLVKDRIQSKITFETDNNVSEIEDIENVQNLTSFIKVETDKDIETVEESSHFDPNIVPKPEGHMQVNDVLEATQDQVISSLDTPSDVTIYPHFKISYTDAGTKEYACCINGHFHYKTALLISMKKHTQLKHNEVWDGYCYICKVIVTSQGKHTFQNCFQHYLDKHMDEFPVLDKEPKLIDSIPVVPDNESIPFAYTERTASPKTYINVRPLSELISSELDATTSQNSSVTLPKIESVMSLGAPTPPPILLQESVKHSTTKSQPVNSINLKYEEAQAEVMSKKHRVVLETMLSKDKLVQVFKCAGRYCSFTSDSAEDSLMHASTHQRIGGEKALDCAYCDFNAAGNAIDLVMHIFKTHGRCQFSCDKCFYRAVAPQLVGAHISRVHPMSPNDHNALKEVGVAPAIVEDSANMLPREQAVQYYVCSLKDQGSVCKFRSYTQGKFYEHLQQVHKDATVMPCNVCGAVIGGATELIQHLKSHGMSLYQCTWCVYGADSEPELLAHASAKHPTKQPQTYLRIYTNKDGSSELRVLPLAYMTKSTTPTELVSVGSKPDNPVRDAERSLELEKLIGDTNNMIEAMSVSADSIPQSFENAPSEIDVPITVESPKTLTPAAISSETSQQPALLKTEPVENAPINNTSDVIYCLDSDEEQPVQNASIQLSNDNNRQANSVGSNTKMSVQNIPVSKGFYCPLCSKSSPTILSFKRHFCFSKLGTSIACPHCQLVIENNENLIKHYVKDHGCGVQPVITCCECNLVFKNKTMLNKHMKKEHKLKKSATWQQVSTDGNVSSGVDNNSHIIYPPRKLSGSNSDLLAGRRFGPQDIDQLPINPILDNLVYCSLCEFNTKVRLNMVRHLQLHAEQQPVPQTAPVNPVPHLETNEKHFDKMVNLASSSALNRVPEKPLRTENPVLTSMIPPEAAARYPTYVPERQRHTCGATGCSYISVDEAMLKRHWEALHSGTTAYHCVHCPPYQQLDTSRPLTAARIMAHLKMHGVNLYACSLCSYYHFEREIVEKHLNEVHKAGESLVVREDITTVVTSTPTPFSSIGAPTMDLKPWQCGLCELKSMLRPEVVSHCFTVHQSKMQFKCSYCPFRTSAIENVKKHQLNAHPTEKEEIFYFYYREGSIPDEPDGTPRWKKQRRKMNPPDHKVKSEGLESTQKLGASQSILPSSTVDLNLVKKEVAEESPTVELSFEELCKTYGNFCEPNGIKYKCSLCKIVTEDTREAMQSHLYEELQYRRWSCAICKYKAFHKSGLRDHMTSEHFRQKSEPVNLPIVVNIEKWVSMYLDYQSAAILKNRQNLMKQKVIGPATSSRSILIPIDSTTKSVPTTEPSANIEKLIDAFGPLGAPKDMQYCCPKCNYLTKDQIDMRNHLEGELNLIRWCCDGCPTVFHTYHQAQFHCRSAQASRDSNPNKCTRPREAPRDPNLRSSWLAAVLEIQNRLIKLDSKKSSEAPTAEVADASENSLLVVRYEERVPTPEGTAKVSRKRPASIAPSTDSEEDRQHTKSDTKNASDNTCQYCNFTSKYKQAVTGHILTHFNMRPFTCAYCDFQGYRKSMIRHLTRVHPKENILFSRTQIPINMEPLNIGKKMKRIMNRSVESDEDFAKNSKICLNCGKSIPISETGSHVHDNARTEFANKGDVVVKCCVCLMLRSDVKSLEEHHNATHPDIPMNYSFHKVRHDTRDMYYCLNCNKQFRYLRDLKTHHNSNHPSLMLKYNTVAFNANTSTDMISVDDESGTETKRKGDESILPEPKRCARKSTTKLPHQAVAKKSTTKLPFIESDSDDDVKEYSFYGTEPRPLDDYSHVTTLMSFLNTMMPFKVKKLREIIKIDPKVVVKDINK